jgi:hypothetical protein
VRVRSGVPHGPVDGVRCPQIAERGCSWRVRCNTLIAMPRRTFVDHDALSALLRATERVVRHSELLELGVPSSTIMWRISPSGPWQRLLPGVLVAHRGIPTRRERLLAALRYAGPQSVVTGTPALVEYGVTAARKASTRPHMLVPHECRKTSHGFVVIERTRRVPTAVVRGLLRLAPLPRAVVDACRRRENLDHVREIVAEVVQHRRCSVADIVREVREAARQRTALTRAVLREVEAGVRSVAEARVRSVLLALGVDGLEWNIELWTRDGEFVGSPDAYCSRTGVALQVDSMEWHLAPAAYKRTQARQRDLAHWGVFVLPWSPADAVENPDEVVRGLIRLRELGARRPTPDLVVRRSPA